MKKILLCISLVFCIHNTHATTAKKVATAAKWSAAVSAGSLGAAAGAFVGGIGTLVVTSPVLHPESKAAQRAIGAGIVGGALAGGAAAGLSAYSATEQIASSIAIKRIMKKHNVSREIALASWYANVPINQDTLALFLAAQQGDKQSLFEFLRAYYLSIFGEQWNKILYKLMGATETYKPASAKLQLLYHYGNQGRKFIRSIPISYAIAILYFRKKFPEFEFFKTKVEYTKALLDDLLPLQLLRELFARF